MKICLSCSKSILYNSWKCDFCGYDPVIDNGVIFFAPHIYGSTESYDPSWYDELVRLETNNFWFVARNRLINYISRKYLPSNGLYLEVGCGTGFVLQMLHKSFPNWKISATEAQPEGISFARNRLPDDVIFYQMDACKIPFHEEFDVIGAFDVIEHIPDDTVAISQIYDALKKNGYFIVSVPQHMFLWSKYDEVGCHFRRYSVSELESKLKNAGFSILLSTSFNSLLLPLMILSRATKRGERIAEIDVLDELRLSPIVNVVLSLVLRFEYILIRFGFRFPFGGSRMVVAVKNKS